MLFPDRQILSIWDYQPSKAKKAITGIEIGYNWSEVKKVRLVEKRATSKEIKKGSAPKIEKSEDNPDAKLKRRIEIAKNKLYREQYEYQLAEYVKGKIFVPTNVQVTRKVLQWMAENMFEYGRPGPKRIALVQGVDVEKFSYDDARKAEKKIYESKDIVCLKGRVDLLKITKY